MHLAFNFNFISAPFEAAAMRAVVEETEAALPPGAWPAWTGSNHDMFRFPTRWAGDDPDKARAALLMLLGLRGTPVLYQGDEIGQLDATLTQEDLRDPLGVRYWPYYAGRDAGRTPMQWRDVPGGGFTDPGVVPWLPLGDLARHNVESQRCGSGLDADVGPGSDRAAPPEPGPGGGELSGPSRPPTACGRGAGVNGRWSS